VKLQDFRQYCKKEFKVTAPAKINFKIYQGTTFEQELRWESETKTYVPIIGIAKSAPVQITVADPQSLPPLGWRVRVTNALGMKEINMPEGQYELASKITGDVLELNQINSLSYNTYTSGGVVEYNTPVPIIGYAASMQIRRKLSDPEVVLSLTTQNGGIRISTELQTITIYITSAQTSLLNFAQAVYDLELIAGDGTVYRFAEGNLLLRPEVTR